MDKTKRMSPGVQKCKTKPNKQNTKTSLNNVLDYLKSDCYMFAPLISPPLSGRVKMKEPIKGYKKRPVLKRVGKYMKSDTCLYAPFGSSKPVDSLPSGQFLSTRKAAVEISTTVSNLKENGTANAIAEKRPRNDSCPGKSNFGNQTSGRGEMVKHMVYQHCRSDVGVRKGNARLAAKEARC